MELLDSRTGKYKHISLDETVKLYVCGPTVYDDSHLGHARTYMTYDVIVRILRGYFGFDVSYAMNITDVDDKIIQRSKASTTQELTDFSRKYEDLFFQDLKHLGIQHPDIVLRVTEHIDSIILFIDSLMKKGVAYLAEDGVYFDIGVYQSKGYDYFQFISPEHVSDSKNPDFALWKLAKEGPSWDSPWGYGRPGWHIECSVMASIAFGDSLTIHGGGVDLKFPHHNNELSQSQAYFEKDEYVEVFLHTNHLGIRGQKMSKSLKNFVTIRNFLEQYKAEDLRWLFLTHHWAEPMNLDLEKGEMMKEAGRLREIFFNFHINLQNFLHHGVVCETTSTLGEILTEKKKKIDGHLRNNFDTPSVVKDLEELLHSSNKRVLETSKETLSEVLLFVEHIQKLLGLPVPKVDFDYAKSKSDAMVLDFLSVRDELRSILKSKSSDREKLSSIWKVVDDIRDQKMPEYGIVVKDDDLLNYFHIILKED